MYPALYNAFFHWPLQSLSIYIVSLQTKIKNVSPVFKLY